MLVDMTDESDSEATEDKEVPVEPLAPSRWAQAPSPPVSKRLWSILRRRSHEQHFSELIRHVEGLERLIDRVRRIVRETRPLLIKERVKVRGRVAEENRIELLRYVVRNFDRAALRLEEAIRIRDYVSASLCAFEMQDAMSDIELNLFKAEAVFREEERLALKKRRKESYEPSPTLRARNDRIIVATLELHADGLVQTKSEASVELTQPEAEFEGLSPRTIMHVYQLEGFELPY